MILEYTEEQEKEFNKNGYGEPIAYIGIDTGETLEIIFDRDNEKYSMLIHDAEGNLILPYYNADTFNNLLQEICEY